MNDEIKNISIKVHVDDGQATTALKSLDSIVTSLIDKMGKLSSAGRNAGSGISAVAPNTYAARDALFALGSALGDAGKFQDSFSAGMRALAGNIPAIVSAFNSAKKSAGDMGSTIGKTLVSSLAGPGGLMLAINGAMLLLDLLPGLFAKVNEQSRKAANEGLTKFNEQLKEMTSDEIISLPDTIDTKIQKLKFKKFKERNDGLLDKESYLYHWLFPDANADMEMLVKQGEIAKSEKERILKENSKLAGSLKQDIEDIENLKQRIPKNVVPYLNAFDGETKKLLQKFIKGNLNDVKDAYQQLVDVGEEKSRQLTDLNKSTEQKNKEREQLNLKREQEEASELENQKKLWDEKKEATKFNFIEERQKLELAQNHGIRMAEIEKKNDNDLLVMKKQHYEQMIDLYISYGEDITALDYELIETRAELQKNEEEEEKKHGLKYFNPKTADELNDKQKLKAPDSMKEVAALSQEEKEKIELENIDDVYLRARREANIELETARKKFGNLEVLNERHRKKIAKIDEQEQQHKLEVTEQTFKQVGGLFAKHTAAYKVFAIANTIIDTYQSAMAAYKSAAEIPLVGFVLAPVMAAAAIKFGMDKVANIAGIDNSMPGYARGGAIVGEDGPEIIAPFQDYASGQSKLITMTMMTLREELRSGRGSDFSSGNTELMTEVRRLNENFSRYADRPFNVSIDSRKVVSTGLGKMKRMKL